MNDHDRGNLMFLMRSDSKTLKQWFETATADDLAYAQELLAAYNAELDEQNRALDIEDALDNVKVYPEAQAVLAQFRL